MNSKEIEQIRLLLIPRVAKTLKERGKYQKLPMRGEGKQIEYSLIKEAGLLDELKREVKA